MTRYFKYVSIFSGREDWMLNELKEGRARFGWSGAGSNLNEIKSKSPSNRTAEEKVTWKYTQFMVNRLSKGDRLIIQLSRPLRGFLIAEVVGEYHSTEPEETDFNHFIECKLLTDTFIRVDSKAVSQQLRHHLSKRGQYYEIYDEDAKQELDILVERFSLQDPELFKQNNSEHSGDFEKEALEEVTIKQTYQRISKKWPGAYFEKFVGDLIDSIPGVEINKQGDHGLGWDLTMRILDPIDGSVLKEDIPVQCKNYEGKVKTTKPLKDLERCAKNSNSSIAYLFIMGDLTEEFNLNFDKKLELVKQDQNRDIEWRIIDQEQIAKLYLQKLSMPV